ncbi:MAG: dephospho-CoA kinase [Bacteroidetes bacterium]|nr:dephospho-CoA kinase [Bacteroidota bacterium]
MSSVRTLGVTGGIGSGKSMVCSHLKRLGAILFEADIVARTLMESDSQVQQAVVDYFGSETYHADGSLNRPWLASQVFDHKEHLNTLNSIIHPRVAQSFHQIQQECSSGLLVHEAALIYEAHLEHHLDAVCVVSAPAPLRIQRVVSRDGISEDAVRARMRHQLPQHEIESRADVVLINAGDPSLLHQKTDRLFHLAMSGNSLQPETFREHRQL